MIARRIWTYKYSDFDRMTAYSKYSFSRAATLCLIFFAITWLPSTANRVYPMIYEKEDDNLTLLHAIFSGLRGFTYSLLYLFFQISTTLRRRKNPNGVSMADNGFIVNRKENFNQNPFDFVSKDNDVESVEETLRIFHSKDITLKDSADVEHPSLGHSEASIGPIFLSSQRL